MVFIIARDDEATRQLALKGGPMDLLRKPICREALLTAHCRTFGVATERRTMMSLLLLSDG